MKQILFLTAVLFSAVVANAKVWRVNPNEAARADFLSVTDACNAAKVTRGDTLYCEPGSYQGTQTISKPQLTLLGPGWEIPTNFGSTSTISAASFSETLRVSADTITISGLRATRIEFADYAHCKHITIERCMLGVIYGGYWSEQLSNISIRNNFFTAALINEAIPIELNPKDAVMNVSIENNIIVDYTSDPANYSNHYNAIFLKASNALNTSGLIAHNTIVRKFNADRPAIVAYYAAIRDNIIINISTYNNNNEGFWMKYSEISTCEMYKNVFSCVTDNVETNILNHYADNYFIGATVNNTFTKTIRDYAEESYYELKEGSVAANKAYQGEDCGAYAGAFPFVVNGRPRGVPYIYDVTAPNYPENDVLNISFKVKANNQ